MPRQQRVTLEERESKRQNPLFKNTSTRSSLVKRTYTLPLDLIKALDIYAAYTSKDKSEIIRDALHQAIPDKYIDEARSLENSHIIEE